MPGGGNGSRLEIAMKGRRPRQLRMTFRLLHPSRSFPIGPRWHITFRRRAFITGGLAAVPEGEGLIATRR